MITPESLKISMDDCRKAGHCASGVRRWFGEQHLDFRAFMADGIPAADMLATGDAQGRQVVARTVQRRIMPGHNVSEAEAIALLEGGIL
jgi:hypothetical protein